MIAPVLELRLSPIGKDGDTPYVSVPVPFVPVTGVKLVAEWFCVRIVEAIVCVAVTAEPTVKLKVAVAVALLASITVTVKVVAASVPVGVPVIAPVAELINRPVGSAGEML